MLEHIIAHGNRGHVGFGDGNRVTCADGTTLSVIAGGGTYCSPRPAMCTCGFSASGNSLPVTLFHNEVSHDYPGPYDLVEVGFPSVRPEPWDQWREYAEDAEEPTRTVYAYVPVDMVRQFVAAHGGESEG